MSILMGRYSLIKLKIGKYEQHNETNKLFVFIIWISIQIFKGEGGLGFFFLKIG